MGYVLNILSGFRGGCVVRHEGRGPKRTNTENHNCQCEGLNNQVFKSALIYDWEVQVPCVYML